jgi:hypothetical protein
LAADERIERVLRHAAESVVAPAVIGKHRRALLVGKTRQPADAVVGVRRGGHQFRAGQVGVAVDGGWPRKGRYGDSARMRWVQAHHPTSYTQATLAGEASGTR